MMVTYKEIQVNDQIRLDWLTYQIVDKRTMGVGILLCLDRDRPNGKNFLFGFPDSQIHRIEQTS
jgi:hypothetical protein